MADPQDMEVFRRGARDRELKRRLESALRRQLAWKVAKEAACLLKEAFHASRVVVFGSLAHGAWFHTRSDIDLAVEGVSPEVFWRAWSALDHISRSFEINLISIESASESLTREIHQRGIEL